MHKKIIFILFFVLTPFFVGAKDKIDINTATLEQLDGIVGIGSAIGQRIIDARPFSSVDDLDRVKGIGEKTLQKIKDQGLAYVGEKSEIQITKAETNLNDQNLNVQNATNLTPIINYPDGIIINEILPSPKGADETDEWIELYNQNNFEVDLSGWKIADINGTPKTFIIPDNTKVLPNNFLVFKRPDTKIMLNNDADGLNLLTPDNKIIDFINFTSATTSQSYNRTANKWAWSTTPSPASKNTITDLPEVKKSVKNEIVEAGTASLSQSIDLNQVKTKTTNPWFLFYTTLGLTIFSASVVLFIKLKLQKNVRT